MMHMWFWWDATVKNFLFYGFNATSVPGFVFLCVGLLLVAFFFECLKMIHAKVKQKRMMMTQKQLRSICPSESDTLLTNPGPSTSTPRQNQTPPVFRITLKDKIQNFIYDVGLWMCQNIVGYMIMLSVMLYNGHFLVCVVVGSGIGYFVFGPTLMKINIESCRALRSTFCMADCGEPDKTALLAPESQPDPTAGDTSPVCHSISETTAQTKAVILLLSYAALHDYSIY